MLKYIFKLGLMQMLASEIFEELLFFLTNLKVIVLLIWVLVEVLEIVITC